MKKKNIINFIKAYLFEICAFFVAILFLVQLFNVDFSRRLITGFDYLRPDYTFSLFIIFSVLTIVLILLLFMQTRKKELKSTKKITAFSKTVERSHMFRKMSQTQVVYTADVGVLSESTIMPKDIDKNSPIIVELYFSYEETLNI